MASSNGKTYEKVSQAQREILENFYNGKFVVDDNGTLCMAMQSTRAHMKDTIQAAARETGLSKEKIEKWIGNENLKRRKVASDTSSSNASMDLKKPQTHGNRKNCGYNLFCKDFFMSDEAKTLDQGYRLRKAGEKWRAISDKSREYWNNEAKKLKVSTDLSESEKAKLVAKHKRRLCEESDMLEYLGCESVILLLDGKEVMTFGSKRGEKFLADNFHVTNSFRAYFDAKDEGQHDYSYKDVQDLFNKKYADAVNQPGAKVPYLRKGFIVEGLPEGIPFRKPCDYGRKQINRILERNEDIRFVVRSGVDNRSEERAENDATGNSDVGRSIEDSLAAGFSSEGNSGLDFDSVEFSPGLMRLVELERAKDAQLNGNLIREDELEVLHIQLRPVELEELLSSWSHLFDDDALASLKGNAEALLNKKGLLLPTYTTARSNFWLFYFDGCSVDAEKLLETGQSVPGLWLHKVGKKDSRRYKLKSCASVSTVTKDNIIKDSKSREILKYEIDKVEVGSTLKMPENFHQSIYCSLAADGFLIG